MHHLWRSVRLYVVLLLALMLPLVAASHSHAQDGPLVVATWGGAYTDAFREAFADPFSAETGVEVQIVDAPGGYNAMLEAQAAAGNVTWDLIDLGEEDAVALIDAGLLQPLPDDLKSELIEVVGEENVTDYGISFASYGSVIACNAAAAEACPTTPAEFWDVEGFPGRRTMYGDGWSDSLVYALLADGVPKEELFPLDVDRAFAKLDEIKPHINVWWTTGDQSQQIFRDEEVVMGILWDGRAAGLREQGVDIQLSFEGSPISRDLLVVPSRRAERRGRVRVPPLVCHAPRRWRALDRGDRLRRGQPRGLRQRSGRDHCRHGRLPGEHGQGRDPGRRMVTREPGGSPAALDRVASLVG